MIVLRGDEESAYRTQRAVIDGLSQQLSEMDATIANYRDTITELKEELNSTKNQLQAANAEVDRWRAVMGKPARR